MSESNKQGAPRLLRWLDDAATEPARYVPVVLGACLLFSLSAMLFGVAASVAVPLYIGVITAGVFELTREPTLRKWLLKAIAMSSLLAVAFGGLTFPILRDPAKRGEDALPPPTPHTPTTPPFTPRVTASAPPSPEPVVAEDWKGQTFDIVEEVLENAGITVIRKDTVSTNQPSGTILAQSVPSGRALAAGSITFKVAVPPPPPTGRALLDARVLASDLSSLEDAEGYERQEGRGGFMSFSSPSTGIYLCEDRPVSSEAAIADSAVSSFEDNANFGIDHAVGSEITSFYDSPSGLFKELEFAASDCGGWRVRPMKIPRGAVDALHFVHEGSVVEGPIDEGDAPTDWVFIQTSNVLIQIRVQTEDAEQSELAATLALRCLERLLR